MGTLADVAPSLFSCFCFVALSPFVKTFVIDIGRFSVYFVYLLLLLHA